ncbi:MAG: 4-hydroxy-2-oxo-heptane-1,7-dioate aldolase [Cereibacter sphaeroides]|uniref:Hydroxypyruvate/pyruvate aldolase n=1 Tax=Cereibacter sphaeroides TaxID=1063 RepID=A0A2W5SI94_CERSP|nr:MAG: 4-hydroxy-2-oxo-heptane-1,7-dioate aldolase [Cereibacter sphaeroides]
MDLPVNHFKQGLKAGRQQIGLWNSIPGPIVAEAVATAGFDWIVIDTEHSLTDVPDTIVSMQAMAPYPVTPVVRAAWNDMVLIKRYLDLGVQTLLLPFVQSADEAQAAVTSMRYAPRGMRGAAGMTRANRYGSVTDYMARVEEQLCLLVQVETELALSRIEEIAAVDGVDGLFIGPNDLAGSMGYPGQPGHPEVQAAIRDAIARITASGKAAGILTFDPAFARNCMGLGTTFTAVGMDLALLVQAARKLAADFRP